MYHVKEGTEVLAQLENLFTAFKLPKLFAVTFLAGTCQVYIFTKL